MRSSIALVVLGVVLAAALGFAAHVVAQDTVALPAVKLEGGRPLAPQEAEKEREDSRDAGSAGTTQRTDTGRNRWVYPARTATVEDQKNEGRVGRERPRQRSDNSGSDSDNSGPGSDDLGSRSDDSGQGRGRGRGRGGDD